MMNATLLNESKEKWVAESAPKAQMNRNDLIYIVHIYIAEIGVSETGSEV
jgi:hypothetical protein